MNRTSSYHEWPPRGADDTGAQLAVLAERQGRLAADVKDHDEQLGKLAGVLGRIEGGLATARWAVPLVVVVAGSFFSTAIVIALKLIGK